MRWPWIWVPASMLMLTRSSWSVWLRCTPCRHARWGSREWPELKATAGPAGGGGAEGQGIVMGCDEPLARGGGVVERVGAVWFGADRACRWAFRGAQVCCWWAGGRARLSRSCHSGAKHGGTQGDTLRRFVQVGGRGGTSWDG